MQLNHAPLVNSSAIHRLPKESCIHRDLVVHFTSCIQYFVTQNTDLDILNHAASTEEQVCHWVSIGNESIVGWQDHRGVTEIVSDTNLQVQIERKLNGFPRTNRSSTCNAVKYTTGGIAEGCDERVVISIFDKGLQGC